MAKYAVVDQYYNQYLGRQGEAAGVSAWDNTIDSWFGQGMTGDQINQRLAGEFQNSAEGQAYGQNTGAAWWRAAQQQAAAPQTAPVSFSTGGGGSFNAPTFQASDFYKMDESQLASRYGMDVEGFRTRPDLNTANNAWNITDDARQRYGIGSSYNNFLPQFDEEGNIVGLQVKSGEKEGTNIGYTKQADGSYAPTATNKLHWDTNPGKQNLMLASVALAAVGGIALAGSGLVGAGAASGAMPGAAGMTGAGIVAEGGVAAGAGAAAGTATGGYGFSQVPGSYGASLGNMSVAPGTAAAGAAPWQAIPGFGSAVSGGSASFLDNAKTAYDYYKNAKRVQSAYNALTGGGTQQQGGGRTGMTQSQGGDMNWLSQLFNAGGAMYSANKNDNYADEMRAERERSLAERQPFLDRMNELRGDEGAERFRQGGQWQAAERVAANQFTRRDASRGNLANDTDRTRLLQDHFSKNLDAARTGARSDLTAFDEKASRDALMKAIEMDRMKNSPLFAAGSYGAGGGGGSLSNWGQLPGMISGAAGQIGNWYDDISNWYNGGVTGDAIESWPIDDWLESGISGL